MSRACRCGRRGRRDGLERFIGTRSRGNSPHQHQCLAYVGWALALLVLFLLSNLVRSRIGRHLARGARRRGRRGARRHQPRPLARARLRRQRRLRRRWPAAVLAIVVRLAAPSGFTVCCRSAC